jgi:hypothetical protein
VYHSLNLIDSSFDRARLPALTLLDDRCILMNAAAAPLLRDILHQYDPPHQTTAGRILAVVHPILPIALY